MNYQRKEKEKEIYANKYKQTKRGYINKGYYYDKDKEKIVKILRKSSCCKETAKRSNRKIRRTFEPISNGGQFKNIYEKGNDDW